MAGGRAVAAVTVLALGVVAVWTRLGTQSPATAPGPASAPAARLAPETSAAMERWLASLPSEPAVVRVGTRAAVTGLEDRIAQVDDLLSAERLDQAQPARLATLQQERTRLVGALVQVRYAETLADELR
ncbi:MAG TPA: hypothetical protein VGD47_03235 [Steroidobacteraceae bacterium]